MHSSELNRVLCDLPAGEFQLAVCSDIDDALAQIASLSREELAGERVVALAWTSLPNHTQILDESIDQLAKAALATWPHWFSTIINEKEPEYPSTLAELLARARQAAIGRSVLHRWLTLADRACQIGRAPRWPSEFTSEVEAHHLALALGGQTCRLVLAVRTSEQDSSAQLGLARAAEWLARTTHLPTLILAPRELARSPDLDSISFGAIEITNSEAETLAQNPQNKQRERQSVRERGSRLIVRPLVGRPHPDSLGELLLWEKLQADTELYSLFSCNQWTSTVCATTHLVDFIWRSGKLIVEVDGYHWHSSRFSFSRDRRRDYELHLSGYLVIRLPHDEVINDVDGVVEKIRRMVRYRRQA